MIKPQLLLLFLLTVATGNAQNSKPNIVVILADDLGWADLTSYGSRFYETPNLDALAADGVKFTQGYASCPVCSPTRASLMTGKYPVKTGVTDWIRGRQDGGKAAPYEKLLAKPTAFQLALNEKTIAELALENGYKTFFAGKWHLGEEEKYWPEYQGFQTNIGGWSKGSPQAKINDTTGGYFTPYKNPTIADGPPGEYLTDRLASECINFMEKNRSEPFLLLYSLYAVHNPLQAPTALIKKYEAKKDSLGVKDSERFAGDEEWMKNEEGWQRRLVQDNPTYAAMVENMDWNIGRIIKSLKEMGLYENTLLVFTSDNGGLSTAEGSPTVNGPLRAGKGWLYEGGLRVPTILYWKGKFIPGRVSEIPVSTVDIFPTIAKAMNRGYSVEKTVDGNDIAGLLEQPEKQKARTLLWHYPHYSNQGGKPGSVIRQGNYKLIYFFEENKIELYDVINDIGETKNLAATHKALAKKMKAKLFAWLKETGATFPDVNPDYNPSTPVKMPVQDE